MSWLRPSPRNGSVSSNKVNSSSSYFQSSNSSNSTTLNVIKQRPIDSATDCDPRACYDSFCKHWQQAYEIIQRSEAGNRPPSHDDVLGVVSHLDFMVTLILVELHHCNKIQLPSIDSTNPPAPCLEYLLSENLLDKLYEWGCRTGRYSNAVRLEQLKLYELLVSHSRHQLLCHEPFLRPLLKILASSQGEIFPPDLEKRLVILLNQLCVVLMQNVHLLDLFFFTAQTHELQQQNGNNMQMATKSNFILFSLLIPYVHREGSLGHQARDALLLCMALSQKNSNIGTYIAQYSSMCPLLVTGLGGLYSRLPSSIEITSIDWHRITPDDVAEIPELTLFMNALEFCNAVVQVAHEMIKQQLLDFLYQGFIVPVLGPAILQTNIDSQISTMSYFDLMLRSITEPSLMRLFIKFLLDTEKFDGERILDSLIERLSSSDANLCMVTMALFDTLLSLHCEDLMLELLLKYLLPGKHIPISYRHKINNVDPYANTSDFFMDLTPDVMKRAHELTKRKNIETATSGQSSSVSGNSMQPQLPSPSSTMSKTIGANWNYYGLITGESLYANFHAYLFDAHIRIAQCQKACTKWTHCYKYQKWPPRSLRGNNSQFLEMAKQYFIEFNTNSSRGVTSYSECSDNSDKKQLDSLQSLGESSGYESFKWRPNDDEMEANENQNSTVISTNSTLDSVFSTQVIPVQDFDTGSSSSNNVLSPKLQKKQIWKISNIKSDILSTDFDLSEDLFAKGAVNLGPFLNAIWGKLQTFTSNSLYVNFHLTGLITRLAWYPLPLIHSLLLRPDIVTTTDTPSFYQVLRILKQQIDAELPVIEDSLEIIDIARSHLIDREFRLITARKPIENSLNQQHQTSLQNKQHIGFNQRSNPMQVTPSSSYDPFRRNETIERKSFRKSISNIFNRKTNGSTPFANGNNNSTLVSQGSVQTRETSLTIEPTRTTNPNANATSNLTPSSKNTQPTTTSSRRTTVEERESTNSDSTTSNINAQKKLNGNTSQTSKPNVTNNSTANVNTNVNSGPASLDSLSSMGTIANTSGNERTRDLALCAVLLDEWLKELAAIAQEQSVVLINNTLGTITKI